MTIEKYTQIINQSNLSKNTIIKYISNLNSLENETGGAFPKLLDNEILLFNHINESKFYEKNQRKYSVISYINTMNLPNKYFIENTEPMEYVRKIEKVYPKLQDLKKDRVKQNDKYIELILNLLLNYNALRTDIANVKVRNYTEDDPRYVDGEIIYPTINKVKIKENIVIKLNKIDREILNNYSKEDNYIFKTESTNRNNAFGKYVKLITQKYLGQALTLTDLRHIKTADNFEKTDITKDNLEKLILLTKENGHSLNIAVKHYM